jgi:hypothetical protein
MRKEGKTHGNKPPLSKGNGSKEENGRCYTTMFFTARQSHKV